MISKYDFIIKSLDINVFFIRIMKEHSFFLQASFTSKDKQLADKANNFRIKFENLLSEAVDLANNHVSKDAIDSQQIVTPYTIDAEKLTSFYTGVRFNTAITARELTLMPENGRITDIENEVTRLNNKAIKLTANLIAFKEDILAKVLECKIFTFNYPLLIEHILREARLFVQLLTQLNERSDVLTAQDLIGLEQFWNRQMAEHAKFIDGLLDPTEETLKETARMFGREFDKLTAEAREANQRAMGIGEVTAESIAATKRLRDFKTAGTQGLLSCNIKSIIIPLLADHVLREANHYLCIMGVCRH